MRVDGWLFAGIAACGGATAAVHPGPALAAALAFAVIMRRRVAPRMLLFAAALFVLGAIRAEIALDGAGEAQLAAAERLSPPAVCEVVAEVVRSPVVLRRDRPREDSLGEARLDLQVRSGSCQGADVTGMVVRLYGGPESLGRGDVLRVEARLAAVRAFDNPDLSDPRIRVALTGYAASGSLRGVEILAEGQGIVRLIDGARAFVRRRIEATYPRRIAPFARALVLGESNLEHEDGEAFRASGLSHLLAVSGTHLIIAVVALGRALRSILVRIELFAGRYDVGRLVAAFCFVASWLYAELAGGGGSAYRAAAMLSCAMLVRLCGWKPDAVRAFAWSILGGALAEPLVAFDLSFALSVAATAGLLLGQRPVRAVARWLGGVTGTLVGTMLTTVGATAACAPLILCVGPQLPVLGVFANVIAGPIGELAALPVALVHCVLWWAPAAEQGAATVAAGALALVRAIAHGTSGSSFATLDLPPPTAWQLAALSVGACWILVRPDRRRVPVLATATLVAALELVARAQGAPEGVVRITVLDVGQGDAILVDLPDGSLMLVDAGGLVGSPIDTGARVVLPVLRARRRDRIDVAVLSHPHPDHFGGLAAVLAAVPAVEIWDSGLSRSRPGALATALEAAVARGAVLRDAQALCEGPRSFGAATVAVLGPCPTYDDLRSANDNSLVLQITFGDHTALLAGDAEAEEEALLIEQGVPLRADFLKVGHHGSRTSSTTPFLTAVDPGLAAISCGVRNRFGHPHPEALDRLAGASVRVLRTDRGGAIVWQSDGETAEIRRRHTVVVEP